MAETLSSLDELKGAVDGTDVPAAAAFDATPREPVRDALGRSYATGKRKDAVARVWIKPGSGKVTVNGKAMDAYFRAPGAADDPAPALHPSQASTASST